MEGGMKKKAGEMYVLVVGVVLLVLVVSGIGGASARSVVINHSTVPVTIQRVGGSNGMNDSVIVGGRASMELPDAFATSAITLTNQLTGGTSNPLTIGRNAVMLVQSTGGLLSNAITVLLGTLIQGVLTALTTIIAGL